MVEQIESLAELRKIDKLHYRTRVAASKHTAFDKVALQAAGLIRCPAHHIGAPVDLDVPPGTRLLAQAIRLLKTRIAKKIGIMDGCQTILVVAERSLE